MTAKKKLRKKAGHRRWAARGGVIGGGNRGDIMDTAKRSALMSRIRGTNTGPERMLAEYLEFRGLIFERHVRDLAGRPDIVFRTLKIAVFVDGDFWHGWRFPLWKGKLTPTWQEKIETNRSRDRRNFRKLRRNGWTVIRVWEHQIEQNLELCVSRLCKKITAKDEASRPNKFSSVPRSHCR